MQRFFKSLSRLLCRGEAWTRPRCGSPIGSYLRCQLRGVASGSVRSLSLSLMSRGPPEHAVCYQADHRCGDLAPEEYGNMSEESLRGGGNATPRRGECVDLRDEEGSWCCTSLGIGRGDRGQGRENADTMPCLGDLKLGPDMTPRRGKHVKLREEGEFCR